MRIKVPRFLDRAPDVGKEIRPKTVPRQSAALGAMNQRI
jgi:hypothetical protein